MPDEYTEILRQIREEQVAQREQIKTLFRQVADIKGLTETVHKLATSVELMTQAQKAMTAKMEGLAEDVEGIKEKPGKRWDDVVKVAVTAVVTALITFVVTKLGMK